MRLPASKDVGILADFRQNSLSGWIILVDNSNQIPGKLEFSSPLG
jgi:hypothetical protein